MLKVPLTPEQFEETVQLAVAARVQQTDFDKESEAGKMIQHIIDLLEMILDEHRRLMVEQN
jgi:hypothetical protein